MSKVYGRNELVMLSALFGGLKEKYLCFDLNGDGVITNYEFREVLEDLVGEPCPEEDWIEFIKRVDYDSNGSVSFEEFLYALYIWCVEDNDELENDNSEQAEEKDEVDLVFELLKRKFKAADENFDGYISSKAFQGILNSMCKFSPVDEELLNMIHSEIKGLPPSKDMDFKHYLYGVYLFIMMLENHNLELTSSKETDEQVLNV